MPLPLNILDQKKQEPIKKEKVVEPPAQSLMPQVPRLNFSERINLTDYEQAEVNLRNDITQRLFERRAILSGLNGVGAERDAALSELAKTYSAVFQITHQDALSLAENTKFTMNPFDPFADVLEINSDFTAGLELRSGVSRSAKDLVNLLSIRPSVESFIKLNTDFLKYSNSRKLELAESRFVLMQLLALSSNPEIYQNTDAQKLKLEITVLSHLSRLQNSYEFPVEDVGSLVKTLHENVLRNSSWQDTRAINEMSNLNLAIKTIKNLHEAGIEPVIIDELLSFSPSVDEFVRRWGDQSIKSLRDLSLKRNPKDWKLLSDKAIEVLAGESIPFLNLPTVRATAGVTFTASLLNLLRGITHGQFEKDKWHQTFPSIPFTQLNVGRLIGIPEDWLELQTKDSNIFIVFANDVKNTAIELGMIYLMDSGLSKLCSLFVRDVVGDKVLASWIAKRGVGKIATPLFAVYIGWNAFNDIDLIKAEDKDVVLRISGAVIEGALTGALLGPYGAVAGAMIAGASVLLRSYYEEKFVEQKFEDALFKQGLIQTVRYGQNGWLKGQQMPSNIVNEKVKSWANEVVENHFLNEVDKLGILNKKIISYYRSGTQDIFYHELKNANKNSLLNTLQIKKEDEQKLKDLINLNKDRERFLDELLGVYSRSYRIEFSIDKENGGGIVKFDEVKYIDDGFERLQNGNNMQLKNVLQNQFAMPRIRNERLFILENFPWIENILFTKEGREEFKKRAPKIAESKEIEWMIEFIENRKNQQK